MKKILLAFGILLGACVYGRARAEVVLGFDDLPAGPLSTQYQARGATFNLPLVRDYAATPGFARSGTKAVELCFAAEFCKATLNVDFTAGQSRVAVFVGFTSPLAEASPVSMRAFDVNGALVTQPASHPVVQVNEFMLQGAVTTTTPLDQAQLTVTGPGGTKVSDVLGTIVQPTSAPFGAIRVDESLFPGANTVTLSAHNCHGTGRASAPVTYTPVASGTVVKLLRMEITQATQDATNSVPLVAGKPTVVRLYFATTGSPGTITGVRGDLSGFQQGGNTPFLAQSVGTADVDATQDVAAKRLDLTKSVNFILSPDFARQGITHFRVERLNVEGPGGATLACSGCATWDATFGPMKPFDLVVVPFHYEFSNLTADPGATLFGGLGYVNNVFPLAGNFPTDPSGIRLTLLPTRPTGLVLPRDNDRMLFALQEILDDLLSQDGNTLPADTHILGVAPSGSGGVANRPGTAAFGDTRALEATSFPASDPESYGSIWAQEIAHNFGRLHVSTSHGEQPPTDPQFPYLHGGIGEPGVAIGTEGWNGTPFVIDPGTPADGAKHAHDFMSYGAPNDAADHTHSWVSPFTFKGLMSSFRPQAAALVPAARAAIDKLVVGGTIDATGTARLEPFHITTTGFARASGATGALSVTLLDAAGNALSTFRFDAQAIENSTTVLFRQYVPWNAATKRIVLKRDETVLATVAVSAHKPVVRITRPANGAAWRDGKATIAWQASDADHDALTYTVLYNSGLDGRWVPIATNVTGLSATVDAALLVGSSRARVRVRATDGVNTTEATSGPFTVPEKPPLVVILGGSDGRVVSGSRGAEFAGAAYDPRDGLLPPSRLTWTSDRDGALGTGASITTRKPLSRGAHVITLTASNGRGVTGTRRLKVMAD